jgi:ribose-phosphate pyrophosphokinase
MLVLGFPDYEVQGRGLASALGAPFELVDLHYFPDGETRLRLPAKLPDHVVLCRALNQPNAKLVELMLCAEGARALGAEHLTLVAPYLCYMRQDAAFVPGEVVSQRIVGRFLARWVDALVTVDPHLHRVASLAEVVPLGQVVALSAAAAMGRFLTSRGERPLLVGPDQESEQWVRTVAAIAGLDYVVAHKTRRGDRNVEIALPPRDYSGAQTVLVDDLASTGRTLAVAARELCAAGAARVDVLVTHALFVGDALAVLEDAGVGEIWSSDSVTHSSNAFALASVLADAIA